MGFIKKNLIFTVIMAICILAFATGVYLAFAESGKIHQAANVKDNAESQLQSMLLADPAPTLENVEASAENVAELKAGLRKIREDLERGARITTSADGVGVMAGCIAKPFALLEPWAFSSKTSRSTETILFGSDSYSLVSK